MVFNLVSLKPPAYSAFPSFFDDTITAVGYALKDAGYVAFLSTNKIVADGVNIVWGVGTHLFPDIEKFRNSSSVSNTVIFNMEQIGSSSELISREYLRLLTDYVVLDYNSANVAALSDKTGKLGAAYEFPITPIPDFSCFDNEPPKILYDYIFYGALSERRLRLIESLVQSGLTVKIARGFGNDLSAQILSAKFVLNIHLHSTAIFEVARVLRPLSHGVPILSEISVMPAEVDWGSSGVYFVDERKFVEVASDLVRSSSAYAEKQRAAVAFSRRRHVDRVRHTVETLAKDLAMRR